MELTISGLKKRGDWESADIKLPGYDVEAAAKAAKKNPRWVHFGIGNIFRIFLGGIADIHIAGKRGDGCGDYLRGIF